MRIFPYLALLALLSVGCQAVSKKSDGDKLVVGLGEHSFIDSEAERATEPSKSGKMEPPKALILVADGSEDIEAVTPTDVLRRAGTGVVVASVKADSKDGTVKLANGTRIVPDAKIEDVKNTKFDAIVLPGGLQGAQNLRNSSVLSEMLKEQKEAGRLIAAICASPKKVLEEQGLLGDEPATGYPGVAPTNLKEENVVKSKNKKIITSRGPATAMEFALAIVEELKGKEVYEDLKKKLLFVGA